jgi:hypothetical protein
MLIIPAEFDVYVAGIDTRGRRLIFLILISAMLYIPT